MPEFDRSAEDVGNVIALEHVNLTVPDQGMAALFYVTAMGFTQDPYIDFGGRNMWVNVGAQQFQGPHQHLVFRETADPPGYDGHHIAVYVADFSAPHRFLTERALVTEESDRHQYRFTDIVDPATSATLLQLEHEVRALTHPMFNRPLVNRNPAVGFGNYRQGQEVYVPA